MNRENIRRRTGQEEQDAFFSDRNLAPNYIPLPLKLQLIRGYDKRANCGAVFFLRWNTVGTQRESYALRNSNNRDNFRGIVSVVVAAATAAARRSMVGRSIPAITGLHHRLLIAHRRRTTNNYRHKQIYCANFGLDSRLLFPAARTARVGRGQFVLERATGERRSPIQPTSTRGDCDLLGKQRRGRNVARLQPKPTFRNSPVVYFSAAEKDAFVYFLLSWRCPEGTRVFFLFRRRTRRVQ